MIARRHASNHDGGLNQILNTFVKKMPHCGDVLSKLMQLKRIVEEAWGRSSRPPEAMGFWR